VSGVRKPARYSGSGRRPTYCSRPCKQAAARKRGSSDPFRPLRRRVSSPSDAVSTPSTDDESVVFVPSEAPRAFPGTWKSAALRGRGRSAPRPAARAWPLVRGVPRAHRRVSLELRRRPRGSSTRRAGVGAPRGQRSACLRSVESFLRGDATRSSMSGFSGRSIGHHRGCHNGLLRR
jgi:hypothetical protein